MAKKKQASAIDNTMIYRCEFNRRHPTPEDAAKCPECLQVLAAPTRRRRNAIVDQLQPELQGAAPSSPTASWETISDTTQMSRDVTPLQSSGEAAYPTPSTSQKHPEAPRDVVRDGFNLHFRTPFTARNANDNIVHHSHDLLGNLQTISAFQTTPRSEFSTTSPPPAPPPSPMAPKKTSVEGASRARMLEIEADMRTRRATRAALESSQAASDPNIGSVAFGDVDIPHPSIEPLEDIPHPRHIREIADLRQTQVNLTRQLATATTRSNNLFRRASVADADRDRAYADRDAAEARLNAVRNARDIARYGWRQCAMESKALMMLVGIFGFCVFYRMVYAPEFEYILKRTMEELGLVYEKVKQEYVGPG